MDKVIRGKVYKFGDNIDTDVITPAYTTVYGLSDEQEYENIKIHSFEQFRPDFYKEVAPGSILIAGKNFGCGSHREQASIIIGLLGFKAVLADSVARIFQRNSIAVGFPVFQAPGITDIAEESDELELDMANWKVTNLTTGKSMDLEPFSGTVLDILEQGGIIQLLKHEMELLESK